MPDHYSQTPTLQERSRELKFGFSHVTARQQQSNATSCGPILTTSMIKFAEEFIRDGRITTEGFEAPRRNLATDRIFQMYVNSMEFKVETVLVDEVMLADESLWRAVLSEQRLTGALPTEEICRAISKQKAYIASLEVKSLESPDSLDFKKVQLIKDFQSRLTEIILFPRVMQVDIAGLLALNDRILSATSEENLSAVSSLITKPPILFEAQYLNIVVNNILRLNKKTKFDTTNPVTVSTPNNNSCANWLKILLAIGAIGGGIYLLTLGTIALGVLGAIGIIGGIGFFVPSKCKQNNNTSFSSQERLIPAV